MKVNDKAVGEKILTHTNQIASCTSKIEKLRRSVLSCMLWEDNFYESGESVVETIKALIHSIDDSVAIFNLTVDARKKYNLRHVPLLMCREMARHPLHKNYVQDALFNVIERADELAEFLAIYWKEGKTPISGQVKKGLARAFNKFSEYQFAKYNRDNKIKLRDVMFMVHPKPASAEKVELFNKITTDTLTTPDTWEVQLSSGADKKQTFERLITEKKLGALALLRNLRGMLDAGVDIAKIKGALANMKTEKIFPYRFISAAKYAPRLESDIEAAMVKCLSASEKLPGKTIFIVDVSGSMSGGMSGKSEMTRLDAALTLTIIGRELSDNVVIYATAGSDGMRKHATEIVPDRHGFGLSDQIKSKMRTLGGGGIFLCQVMDYVFEQEKTADRVIVITDEQDCDSTDKNPEKSNAFGKRNYIINIASYQNGIAYNKYHHINGFSEKVFDYIKEFENGNN